MTPMSAAAIYSGTWLCGTHPVKITADVAEANYKTRKDELKACVKSLKFE